MTDPQILKNIVIALHNDNPPPKKTSCPYEVTGCNSRRQCLKCKQAFGGTVADHSGDDSE